MSKEDAPTTPAKSAEVKEVKVENPTDRDGNTPDPRLERYPEGSNARKGVTTLPSGQGGATPHDGVSYQDQWPPNYIPAEKKDAPKASTNP